MIIVTGGAGFIGSNIIKGLNQRDEKDIIVVDDLTDGTKFKNLVNCEIADYLDKDVFLEMLEDEECRQEFGANITTIFHQGACSDTTEWDGEFMMRNNYEYSKALFDFAMEFEIPFIYASSAAVYGDGKIFREERQFEKPLNVYGYSKWQFDQFVRRFEDDFPNQVVGLRYFNVYGPGEDHKKSMASVAFHNHNQIQKDGLVKLFEGSDGYGPGEQRRDFVFVEDVVAVNLWFMDNPQHSGIFNVGTGRSQTFNDIAKSVIAWHGKGKVEYISFPEHLKGRYQSFTEADISALRQIGFTQEFKTVEEGVKLYLDLLREFA